MTTYYQCGDLIAAIGASGNTAMLGVGATPAEAVSNMGSTPLSIYDGDTAVLDWMISSDSMMSDMGVVDWSELGA